MNLRVRFLQLQCKDSLSVGLSLFCCFLFLVTIGLTFLVLPNNTVLTKPTSDGTEREPWQQTRLTIIVQVAT